MNYFMLENSQRSNSQNLKREECCQTITANLMAKRRRPKNKGWTQNLDKRSFNKLKSFSRVKIQLGKLTFKYLTAKI